jgi:hypothetical protein
MAETKKDRNGWHKDVLLDLSGKSRDELLCLKTEIGVDMDSIKGQLEKAKMELRNRGKRSDDEWFRKAMNVLRLKGRQVQQIQARLAAIQTQRRSYLPQVFMKCAEQLLDRDVFDKVLSAAVQECQVLTKSKD